MNMADLRRNILDIKFEDLVWQDTILTKQDKTYWVNKGYEVELTKDEFESKFDIPAECVCYTPSVTDRVLYFNRETLAASPFYLSMYLHNLSMPDVFSLEAFYQNVKDIENKVKNGETCLLYLPNSLRLMYFNLLIQKIDNGKMTIDDLYGLFMDNYTTNDYGFSDLSDETFKKILSFKTEQQKERTRNHLSKYPKTVTIYRGQTDGISTPEEKTHSWSLDINMANFFASRLGYEDSEILVGEIDRDKIIEILDDGPEQEVLVNYADVTIKERIPVYGISYLEKQLPKVSDTYWEYKSLFKCISYTKNSLYDKNSPIHGELHWTLMLSEELNLEEYDRHILAMAALYHDLGRRNDDDDNGHGIRSKTIYDHSIELDLGEFPDEITKFIIKYHCLPDDSAYLVGCSDKAKLLYQIFKDCDALDRVRFGVRDVDLRQLRLPISKSLVKAARIVYEQVK